MNEGGPLYLDIKDKHLSEVYILLHYSGYNKEEDIMVFDLVYNSCSWLKEFFFILLILSLDSC